ncbi:MAG TPA: TetR family transcriptional regulator [Candidatus Agrococcus pullicola]|uniref:TetR family transcriptional regulator n=1 Tax=Candidatus Agrococcus pullicola TaxID=2838429 RepID=A0A9D2C7E3_9MICO|nr:TetR family transcriptional regulator [Candidatus Agrococcus pullicola]
MRKGVVPHRMTGAERRRLLAEAALRVIERQGERGATVRAITAEAGMPLSTFHYIYETRADVIRDVYRLLRTDDEYFVPPPTSSNATMSELVGGMLERWFRSVRDNHRNELGEMEVITHSIRTPGLQHLPQLVHAESENRVIEALHACMRMLGVRATVPLHDVARMILIISNGAVYSYLRCESAVKPGYFGTLLVGIDVFFEPDETAHAAADLPVPVTQATDERVAATSAAGR